MIEQGESFEDLQKKYFDIVARRNAHSSTSILHDVMEQLDVKKGAAYKRMNGTTSMTIEEIVKLSEHFDVSLDDIFRKNRYISFFHPFLSKTEEGIKKVEGKTSAFFDQFAYFLKPLQYTDPSEEKELNYLANEIPIFYYFSHRYIFTFLLSVWNHLHWEEGQIEIQDTNTYDDQIEHFRKEITNNYYGHPVTEVWNSNMLNNLYQQITFCITIRAFKDERFIKRLIMDIEKLINHLREIAVSGVKSIQGIPAESSELKIYLNDFGNYLNLVVYKSKFIKSSFIGYDYPQFIVSHNENFYNYSMKWINKIKKRSVLISSEGYQYRELFFIKLETDFKLFQERIDKLMSIYYN
jgi:hypothetical protein